MITLLSITRYHTNVYSKDSMDRFGDDLTQEVLQYLRFEDKIRLECVSKQWKRCVFQRQFVIEIYYDRDRKRQNSLNGLFRRSDDERQSDEQRLVSVMKKCQNIRKVIIDRKVEEIAVYTMHRFFPKLKVKNIEDLLKIDPNVLPPPRKRDNGNLLKDLLTSNRYAFDSEVLSPLGLYCPNIKSLNIEITGEQDLQFFRDYGHKLKEIDFYGPTDLVKDCLKFCPNLELFHKNYSKISLLLEKDKQFLANLEFIRNTLHINSSNVNEMKSFVDKYSRKMKSLELYFYELTAEELKTCLNCICGFNNLRHLYLSIHTGRIKEPIDESIAMIGQKCTKLLVFDFSYHTPYDLFPISDRFFDVFTHFKAIKKLKLLSQFETVIGSVECFKHCKQLNDIHISYDGLKEDFFTNIATFVPKLQSLRIRTDEKFSDSFINSFHSMNYIEKIDLNINIDSSNYFWCFGKCLTEMRLSPDRKKVKRVNDNCGLIYTFY